MYNCHYRDGRSWPWVNYTFVIYIPVNRLLEYDELQVLVTHSKFGINSGRNLEMPGEMYKKEKEPSAHKFVVCFV